MATERSTPPEACVDNDRRSRTLRSGRLEAGFPEIDNGESERAIKPVAIGWRNWLFVGSDNGGKTAAVLMSLCTTCKAWNINPFAYLRDVLDRVSTHPNRRIDELLPGRWKPAESTDPPGRKG